MNDMDKNFEKVKHQEQVEWEALLVQALLDEGMPDCGTCENTGIADFGTIQLSCCDCSRGPVEA
jgi:hypothetical protein